MDLLFNIPNSSFQLRVLWFPLERELSLDRPDLRGYLVWATIVPQPPALSTHLTETILGSIVHTRVLDLPYSLHRKPRRFYSVVHLPTNECSECIRAKIAESRTRRFMHFFSRIDCKFSAVCGRLSSMISVMRD